MKILRIPAGVYAANCYIVFSEATKSGIVVDPGGDVDELNKIINDNKIDLKYSVLTHGHGDHIGGVQDMKNKYNIPLLIHEADAEMLKDGNINLSTTMAMGSIELVPDRTLKDKDEILFGDLKAIVIHTPGHTKGGICLKINDHLITGDTLFKGSIGRTDLFGGSYEDLIEAIKVKLMVLPGETVVLPGHGQPSTLRQEETTNPFLK